MKAKVVGEESTVTLNPSYFHQLKEIISSSELRLNFGGRYVRILGDI
jgi:hypothetical protein